MTTQPRMFPVVGWSQISRAEKAEWARLGCPRMVPWDMLAPHEDQAKQNHSQSLETLAARGGLSPAEIMCVIENRPIREIRRTSDIAEIPRLKEVVAKFFAAREGD